MTPAEAVMRLEIGDELRLGRHTGGHDLALRLSIKRADGSVELLRSGVDYDVFAGRNHLVLRFLDGREEAKE